VLHHVVEPLAGLNSIDLVKCIFRKDGDEFDEINRIQTRQRLNEVVKTGSPGFIAQGR